MTVALPSGELNMVSTRRADIPVATGRRARRFARISPRGHVREHGPSGQFRGPARGALANCCALKEIAGRGDGLVMPAGVGHVLSSVTSALVLSAALTLLPLVSQTGVAVAGVADFASNSVPRVMTEQELQDQQYEQYQRQYQEYQKQRSVYEEMQAKVRWERRDDPRIRV